MRSGGLPCRFADCHVHFVVLNQSSMAALSAASAQRDEHEIAAHGYHHQSLEDHARPTPYGVVSAPKRPRPIS